MSPSLTADLRQYVEQKIKRGEYASEEDLYADAVRTMKEQEERIVWLRKEIQIGLDELERGEGAPWDLQETKKRLSERLRQARGE